MKIKEFDLPEEILEARDELSYKKLKREQVSVYEDMFLNFVNDLLRANMPMPEKLPKEIGAALTFAEQRLAGLKALEEMKTEVYDKAETLAIPFLDFEYRAQRDKALEALKETEKEYEQQRSRLTEEDRNTINQAFQKQKAGALDALKQTEAESDIPPDELKEMRRFNTLCDKRDELERLVRFSVFDSVEQCLLSYGNGVLVGEPLIKQIEELMQLTGITDSSLLANELEQYTWLD
jgi:hypothetical protein